MSQVVYNSAYAERQLRRSSQPLRRFVKRFYLSHVLKDVLGPTVDFGCGAGQLLERLPIGSIGLEVNPYLVQALREKGLNAERYDPDTDQLSLMDLPEGQFNTLVMSHVLEHLDDAADCLRRITRSCSRLGIKRLIVVVPGQKGFGFDDTHKTFINRAYLEDHDLFQHSGYSMVNLSYFPLNWESVGRMFTFHELKLIYDKS